MKQETVTMRPNIPRNQTSPSAILKAKSDALKLRRLSEPEQVYSKARPVIGFDLGLSRRLAALEERAKAEPKHQLVRVQGTIVLSRSELSREVRAEMEAILAPTEILFLTWRERLNKIDVRSKLEAGGAMRVEMAQGSPTGIPLIRERVEFHILRKDTRSVVEPIKGEMVGNVMVWHLPETAREGDICVQVVSNSQVLAQLDAERDEPEAKEEEVEVLEIVVEAEAETARPRRPTRLSSRRRIELMRAQQQRRHSQQLQQLAAQTAIIAEDCAK